MAIISFNSQKGGVGKSTLARTTSWEANKQNIKGLLADCDPQQSTSQEWSKINSEISCQVFNSVKDIWSLKDKYDLIIIDAPARTSEATLEIAQHADLVVQPVGASRDDLIPAIKLFNALVKAGIDKKKLLFVPMRLSSETEAQVIQTYLKKAGYDCSPFYLMEKASYKQIQNEGKSISEVAYKSLRKQAKDLANFLLNRIK